MAKLKLYMLEWLRTILNLLRSRIGTGQVAVYWYDRGVNFGDLITPYLFKKYGLNPLWVKPAFANVLSTGSILEHVKTPYSGLVWGSGFIDDEIPLPMFESANVQAVRGKLTLKKLGASGSTVVLGDPGLLCSQFVSLPKVKKWKVGVVPHFVDAESEVIENLKNKHGGQLCVVDVMRAPELVWNDLANCEVILSSSLHGLVCSDSLEIPTCWITLSDNVVGAGYKFRDYYSAFDEIVETQLLTGEESLEQLIALTCKRDIMRLNTIKSGLDAIFKQAEGVFS